MKRFIVPFFVMLAFTACTQNNPKNNLESQYSKVFDLCPEAKIINVEQKYEYTEVDFLCGETPVSVTLDPQTGEVLYKETVFKPDAGLMEKIQRKINKQYSEWAIDEISLIETPDTSFVEVELMKNGVETNLYFTQEGKYYKFKTHVGKDSWTVKTLRDLSVWDASPYNLLVPDRIIDMPLVLKELSGVSVLDSSVVLCEQDELGTVFGFNIATEQIEQVQNMWDMGDFEDVCVKRLSTGDSEVTLLRSDGHLFTKKTDASTRYFSLEIPCLNMEGLFYDARTKTNFVACKAPLITDFKVSGGAEKCTLRPDEDKRYIFSWTDNPKNMSVACEIDVPQVLSRLPEALRKNRVVDFNPSAVAVHPVTNELYVLSATSALLAVFSADESRSLVQVYPLPADVYYKPEGLDFFPNGDMIIGSEGVKKGTLPGQLFVMKYQPNKNNY